MSALDFLPNELWWMIANELDIVGYSSLVAVTPPTQSDGALISRLHTSCRAPRLWQCNCTEPHNYNAHDPVAFRCCRIIRSLARIQHWPSKWTQTLRDYTPLQVAVACGQVNMIRHLLMHSNPELQMDPRIRCGSCQSTSPNLRNLSRGKLLHRPLLHLAFCYEQYEATKTILRHALIADHEYLRFRRPAVWLRQMTDIVGGLTLNYSWESEERQTWLTEEERWLREEKEQLKQEEGRLTGEQRRLIAQQGQPIEEHRRRTEEHVERTKDHEWRTKDHERRTEEHRRRTAEASEFRGWLANWMQEHQITMDQDSSSESSSVGSPPQDWTQT